MTGSLTKKQFDILEILEKEKRALTQRELEEKTSFSLGTLNKLVKEMTEAGWINDGSITQHGLVQLEPYKVKRAIILAAGFGERLVPITLNTPKSLVRVNRQRIIDSLIDATLSADIEDITIVRGYLAEQFDQLLYKYPMLKFIDNPIYNEANSISSVMCVRSQLSNAYVFEGDLLVTNPEVIKKYQYSTNFLGFPIKRSDDWCFVVKNGIIAKQTVGGVDCFQEIGISYWDADDGKKLAGHLKMAFEQPGGKEHNWEQVAFSDFKKFYKIALRECKADDVIEIDTFTELKAIDTTYDV